MLLVEGFSLLGECAGKVTGRMTLLFWHLVVGSTESMCRLVASKLVRIRLRLDLLPVSRWKLSVGPRLRVMVVDVHGPLDLRHHHWRRHMVRHRAHGHVPVRMVRVRLLVGHEHAVSRCVTLHAAAAARRVRDVVLRVHRIALRVMRAVVAHALLRMALVLGGKALVFDGVLFLHFVSSAVLFLLQQLSSLRGCELRDNHV